MSFTFDDIVQDKEKIQHALEKRIQKERADIETAEVRIPEEHEHIIRTETEEQSNRLNKLVDQLKKVSLLCTEFLYIHCRFSS